MPSDLNVLWEKALEEYENETDVKLQSKTNVFKRIIACWRGEDAGAQPETTAEQPREQITLFGYVARECLLFNTARNDDRTMGKIRRIFSRISEPLRLLAPIAGNAAGAAFPAAPVLMVVFTHVLDACAKLSDDLDSIEELFEVILHFINRLHLLDRKLPLETRYREEVTRAFCAILKFCTRTHKFIAPKNKQPRIRRLKEWAKALTREGGDGTLKAAYQDVITCFADLDSATIMQTLASVVEIHSETRNMPRLLDKSLQPLSGGIADIQSKLEIVIIRLDSFSHDVEQREKPDRLRQGKLSRVDNSANVDPVERESKNLDFATKLLTVGAESQVRQRLNILEQSYVEGTFGWINREEAYKDLISNQGSGLLVVSGVSGMGKSMLSYLIYKDLLKRFEHDDSTSVVYFTFDNETQTLRSVQNMLYYCAAQLANKDAKYLNELLGVIRDLKDEDDLSDHAWARLYRERFYPEKEKRSLVMILDGVDQLPDEEQRILATHFANAQGSKVPEEVEKPRLPIRFILTTSLVEADWNNLAEAQLRELPISSVLPGVGPVSEQEKSDLPQALEGTAILLVKEKIRDDIMQVARSRVKTLPKLSQLPPDLKEIIVKEVHEKADSFLYVEHTLRQFNAVGNWPGIYNALGSLPNDTTDLCGQLLVECLQHQTEAGQAALKRLIAWLAYSKNRLSLGAATRLLALDSANPGLVLEKEISGRLSRVLAIMDHYDGSDDDTDIGSDDALSNHAAAGKFKSLLGFQEQSFRVYFRKALESTADQQLRLSDHDARVMIFEMTADILTMPRADNKKYSDAEEELISYASKSFLGHLLSLQDLTVKEAGTASNRLLAVLRNTNGALRKLEETIDTREVDKHYCIFGSTKDEVEQAFTVIAKLATDIPGDGSSGAVELTRGELGNRAAVLKYIAKGHIDNWFAADLALKAYGAFRFAHQALCYLEDASTEGPAMNKDASTEGPAMDKDASTEGPAMDKDASTEGPAMDKDTSTEGPAIDKDASTEGPVMDKDAFTLGPVMDKDAFTLGPVMDKNVNPQSFIAVAKWGRPSKTAEDYKRISQTLFADNFVKEALDHAEEGLKLAVSGREKFELSYRIARSKFELWQDALEARDDKEETNERSVKTNEDPEPVSAIDAATKVVNLFDNCLAFWSDEFQGYDDLLLIASNAHQMKARLEVILEGQESKAIQSMACAVALRAPSSCTRFFDDIIETLGERERWHDVIELLRRLENDNPFTGDLWRTTYRTIQRAAKEGTREDQEVVKKLFEKAIEKAIKKKATEKAAEKAAEKGISNRPLLEGAGPEAFETMLWSARYHYLVLGDTIKAKDQLLKILEVGRGGLLWSVRASRTLTDILTEEFRMSRDPEAKLGTMKEMVSLADRVEQRHGSEAPGTEQAHARIPLAIMHRKMGPAKAFNEELDATFYSCLKTLQDDRSDNDPYSFRMLARALTLVPGLEEQAQVAVSCQFSIVDRELYDTERKKNSNDDDAYWSIKCGYCEQVTSKFEDGEYWYLCCYCADLDVCGKCYNIRKEGHGTSRPAGWIEACPWGHCHVKGPIEGWEGIKGGMIKYGETEIEVKDWLVKLEEEWKQCWEEYWTC